MLIYFDFSDFLIGVGLLILLLPFLWRRKHNLSGLLFLSVFWLYILAVVQVVIFPIAINTHPGETSFTPSINLIPFYFGSCFNMPGPCTRGILENILLTLPFGFGINFLVKVKPRHILWLAFSVGLGFELAQLVISLVFKSGFRAVDINDALLNAAGVLLGYVIFKGFAWACVKATKYFGLEPKGLFADIYAVALQAQAPDSPKDT